MTRIWADKEGFSGICRVFFLQSFFIKKNRVISVPPLQVSPALGRSRPDETVDTAQCALLPANRLAERRVFQRLARHIPNTLDRTDTLLAASAK
jgi:hypothetical protein